MANKNNSKLENAAYISIICMTVFTISFVAYQYLSKPTVPTENKVKTGDYLDDSSLELPDTEKVLILFISENCRFCRESEEFYKRVIKSTENSKSIRILAVFPEGEKNSQTFENNGVLFPEKKYLKFSELGVFFTPTVLLLDKERRILDSWSGKLNADLESKVLSTIGGN